MTENFAHDILIVGAGAAGLTLALELARRNLSFRLIDKLDGPFQGSRGKGIQPRSMEVFEDLGIVDRLVAAGGVYPPQRSYREDGSCRDSLLMEPDAPSPGEPYRIPLMVPQFLTEAVMRERLAECGGKAEFGCELVGFAQDASGVTATLRSARGEETLRVRYLVGTDGGRSFVRRALGIGFEGKTLGVRAVVADLMLRGIDRSAWHRFNDDSMQTQLSLCPLAGTPLFQLQAPIPLEGEVDLSATGLTEMIASRSGRHDIVVDAVSWASAFNMQARLAERYRDGRVLLAGDAAHAHPPTGGQGLNTSVQDAYNLGWKLAAVVGGAPQALLDSYEAERRPVAAQMLGLATRLLETAASGPARRGREVHQLDIGYPGSPLALELTARDGGVHAGDRAPDAPCRGAGGQPRRLFELFRGPHWTLLGYHLARGAWVPPARAGLHAHRVGPDGDIVDEDGHLRSAYGVAPGDWVLVRPDGHVGAIVPARDAPALETYLGAVGMAADAPTPDRRSAPAAGSVAPQA
ncbi:FAD-dependent oxidoreductase [Xanthomonas sp. AM6]|uniref:FAD-dependent oxidoreductase n=1 Tax=Xanthomonas sp. AM6 TaxID=2982531 RepID=UPI0021DA3C04|nr:FAD-dependent oxidoreductase [Xanthomonas sp. AM6]UYB50822.1 FAD-dependent oxidoreductase [Xanthomonas sp. AM6]